MSGDARADDEEVGREFPEAVRRPGQRYASADRSVREASKLLKTVRLPGQRRRVAPCSSGATLRAYPRPKRAAGLLRRVAGRGVRPSGGRVRWGERAGRRSGGTSMAMSSPARTSRSGPGTPPSGVTSPTTMPWFTSPESWPSVTKATLPVSPAPFEREDHGRGHAPSPGFPPARARGVRGLRRAARRPRSRAAMASGADSKTRAGPAKRSSRSR